MYKRAALIENKLLEEGVAPDLMEECKILKVAMIDRVIHNLNEYHKSTYGEPWIKEADVDKVVKYAESYIAVSDIISEPTIEGKVDTILDVIREL